jgi:hypothetical protein
MFKINKKWDRAADAFIQQAEFHQVECLVSISFLQPPHTDVLTHFCRLSRW